MHLFDFVLRSEWVVATYFIFGHIQDTFIPNPAGTKFAQISNAIQILMINYYPDLDWILRIIKISIQFEADARNYVFVHPMQTDGHKEKILKTLYTNGWFRNSTVIFYNTSSTVQHVVSNKSIEVFANTKCCSVNCSIFDVENHSDMMHQLNKIRNLHEFIFEKSMRKTLFHLVESDVILIDDVLEKMFNNSKIFMANYIARNLKEAATEQVAAKLCTYKPSNRSAYSELYVSSWQCYRRFNK